MSEARELEETGAVISWRTQVITAVVEHGGVGHAEG